MSREGPRNLGKSDFKRSLKRAASPPQARDADRHQYRRPRRVVLPGDSTVKHVEVNVPEPDRIVTHRFSLDQADAAYPLDERSRSDRRR